MSHLYFFEDKINDLVMLSGEDERHLLRVLRTRVGEQITVSNGRGDAFLCRVEGVNPLQITATMPLSSKNPRRNISVYLSLAKGDKLSFMIQKCTELGAASVFLLPTQNSDVKAHNIEGKLERFHRIALEAAKQCARYTHMQVEYLKDLDDALGRCTEHGEKILVCHESATVRLAKTPLSDNLALFIGPEGGFEDTEIEKITAKGGCAVSISGNILRCETAAVAALALAMEMDT